MPQNEDGVVAYPINLMRQVAGQIMEQVGRAMSEHQAHWHDAQTYISTLPGIVENDMWTLMNLHQQRLLDSYQWQLAFAQALVEAAQYMEDLDHGIRDSFDAQTGTTTNPQAPPETPRVHGPF